MAREVAMARLRGQIATDLHDSVAQTLAGARFRLEALRLGFSSQDFAANDIAEICQSIAAEQDHVRAIIARLRQGQILPGQRDLCAEIAALAQQLSRHWQVTVTLIRETPLPAPAGLVYECQHLVREAVANAVRHGSAKTITLKLEHEARRLRLVITDDGRGFAGPPPNPVPTSLATRTAALGGVLTLASDPGQTHVIIVLPLDIPAMPAPALAAQTLPGTSS
jgi:signal transduction histidine kinase